MTNVLRASIALSLLVGVAATALVARARILPNGRILPGIRVEGEVIPDDVASGDDSKIRAWIENIAASRVDREVDIRVGNLSQKRRMAMFFRARDSATFVSTLRRLGREGAWGERLDLGIRA